LINSSISNSFALNANVGSARLFLCNVTLDDFPWLNAKDLDGLITTR
jgi:hypothetical protein